MFFFLFSIRQGYKEGIFLSNYTYVAISFLCVVGIILSNSKTPMVGLPFFVLAAIPPKSLFSVKGIAITGIVALCIVVILSYSSNLFNNFIALFDMKMQEEGGGSTANLRAKQYSIGWELFSISPLFGNGIGSLGYFLSHSTRYSDILGSESSWLKILPQQGVLGVVAYLYLYKELYGSLKKSAGEYTAIFYCIGLILMETATGFMDMMVFAPAVIVIERYHQLRLQREEILCNKLLRSSIVKENVK